MGDKTTISWTDATWNPVKAYNIKTGKRGWHCERVTAACTNCYAAGMNMKAGSSGGTGFDYKPGHLGKDVYLRLDEAALTQPLRWRHGRKIFPFSMSDIFADFVTDAWLDRIFGVMALSQQHIFQPLTKRPARMRAYLSDPATPQRVWNAACELRDTLHALAKCGATWGGETPWPLPNVWVGTSICDQENAEDFVFELLAAPAVLHFLSAAPLLGRINLRNMRMTKAQSALLGYAEHHNHFDALHPYSRHIGWVLTEGESGKEARPTHPDWLRHLRDDCAATGVAFHHKQNGEWAPGECAAGPMVRTERAASYSNGEWFYSSITPLQGSELQCEDGPDVWRLGLRKAGRTLDGVTHDGFPTP